ncbi:type III-A CRISPR-associated protein Csm2 [Nostoc sp.]|uniref:type III-A CRISPR-associated protein Csm2 n=1 Tax=Nostoc sp. TaxID=1180 RepID=UPI002FF66F8C
MNKVVFNQYMPDYVSPPGETLLETVKELGMSQDDLAEQINLSKNEVDDIIAGKLPITNELASQLEQLLSIPASFWINRERDYRHSLARQLELQRFDQIERNSKSMTQQPIKHKSTIIPSHQGLSNKVLNTSQSLNIVKEITETIGRLNEGLKGYPIRDLVKHAEEFGPYLKQQRLETNQIRKFLDAVNRLKADLTETGEFAKIETEIILLKPKLAYAAARQRAAKPLGEVMSAAIDKVHSKEDFERLVQLIESIIAYHKAEGGK